MAFGSGANTSIEYDQIPRVQPVASYSGDYHSERDQWLGNKFTAARDIHIYNDACKAAPPEEGIQNPNTYISGQARVHLGDNYAANRDIFETGTEAEKKAGKLCLL